jgi:tRNA G26 N,N-dimethylase Trm1
VTYNEQTGVVHCHVCGQGYVGVVSEVVRAHVRECARKTGLLGPLWDRDGKRIGEYP